MTQVSAHMIDKHKQNWRTNGQKTIEVYNVLAFITNEFIIIKKDIYSHSEV